MLRTMILVLIMILITLSALQLGQDDQLIKVLGLTKVPVSQAPKVEEVSPETEEENTYIPPPPPSSSEVVISSRPPRFILDEPLSVAPIPEEEPHPSSDVSISGAVNAEILDPSAEAKIEGESHGSEISVRIPTEEEKLGAAQPYIKELSGLISSLNGSLSDLGDELLGEYLSILPGSRSRELPALIAKYHPQTAQITDSFDTQAEAIFNKMTAALAAIGADDSIVGDARNAYARDKSAGLEHFNSILNQFDAQ